MRQLEPHRMEGIDIFSTTLWHLKKEVDICYLAQNVSNFDRRSREAWCAVGNCFSIQKEHERALKFFQRVSGNYFEFVWNININILYIQALQIDPTYTYAYTLCGHEYISNENFEKVCNYIVYIAD